ncbi:MAG TPA: hypothetical protein DCM40_03610 [Maribacter sp.]|nr:hypothetical protein [Maribacter sp.]|tara:strand:+ start:708 stop:1208 length:501 start_codon:yes stop_codon:yes gene_type:complete
MKNILIILLVSSVAAFSQELKVFNKTIIYEDGSWVNPDEPKFEVKNPKTWVKRNYVRHYMQGSQEITDSIIEVNWKDFTEAAKTGNKIQLKDFIKVFRFKKTVSAVKDHPEAAIVPVGMAVGSAAEGGKGTVMATVGLLKNAGEITLKLFKFVAKPVTKKLEVEAK